MEANPTPRPTPAAAIAAPTKLVVLPKLKDVEGNAAAILVGKLTVATMIRIREESPGMFRKPSELEVQALKSKAAAMTGADRAKFALEHEQMKRSMVIAAAIEPKIGDDTKGPVADGVLPVSYLYDEDLTLLFDTTMSLSGWDLSGSADGKEANGGAAAAGLGTFPDGGAQGSAAGG